MQIYLPIAEMAIPAESIFFVSLFVGCLSGLFGIGGGFLTTPFMIFMGVPPAVAVGTQPCQIAANGLSGMLAHLRKGHVDVKMGAVMLLGSSVGTVIGVFVFKLLKYLGQIDFAISMLYTILLSSIGLLMLYESVSKLLRKKQSVKLEFNQFKVNDFVATLPFKMRFPKSKLYISALLPIGVGFMSGILASILGIGGGFMIVPAMIYIIGMPGIVVAGTSLFQIVFTTSFATLMHAVTNNTVDILLAVILICGGVVGAQIGAVLSRRIKTTHARVLLAVLILSVAVRLSMQVFMMPDELFSTVVR